MIANNSANKSESYPTSAVIPGPCVPSEAFKVSTKEVSVLQSKGSAAREQPRPGGPIIVICKPSVSLLMLSRRCGVVLDILSCIGRVEAAFFAIN